MVMERHDKQEKGHRKGSICDSTSPMQEKRLQNIPRRVAEVDMARKWKNKVLEYSKKLLLHFLNKGY